MKDNEFGTPGYAEFLTKIAPNGKIKLIRLMIAVVSLALLGGLFALTSKIPQIFVIWLVIIVFFAKMSFDFTRRECEYIIASGELELSLIYGSRKRKKLASYKLCDLQKAVRVGSADESLLSGIDKSQIYNACLEKDENRYLLVFESEDGKKRALYISAPEHTLSAIKYYKKSALSF